MNKNPHENIINIFFDIDIYYIFMETFCESVRVKSKAANLKTLPWYEYKYGDQVF